MPFLPGGLDLRQRRGQRRPVLDGRRCRRRRPAARPCCSTGRGCWRRSACRRSCRSTGRRRAGSARSAEVSSSFSSVVVEHARPRPAWRSTGLSTISTSGRVALLGGQQRLVGQVGGVVAGPLDRHAGRRCRTCRSSLTQSEPSSNCGYGSQMVYVPPPAPFDDLSFDDEQAVTAAAMTTTRAAQTARPLPRDVFIDASIQSISVAGVAAGTRPRHPPSRARSSRFAESVRTTVGSFAGPVKCSSPPCR